MSSASVLLTEHFPYEALPDALLAEGDRRGRVGLDVKVPMPVRIPRTHLWSLTRSNAANRPAQLVAYHTEGFVPRHEANGQESHLLRIVKQRQAGEL